MGAQRAVSQEEVIYVLYLKDRVPTVRYLSIKTLKVANAPGVVVSIEDAFNPIQDGGGQKATPPSHQFFPCNFHKRRNWPLKLSDF